MGKAAYHNVIIQVTLDKEVVKTLDGVIEVLNREVDTSKGEKKFTRSMVIQDCLINLFEAGAQFKIDKNKKEA